MILGRVIEDFPYPEKICPYCFKKLTVANAIHWEGDKYHYKALYLDPNPHCPVYDEGALQAYARIYYSSEDAYAYYHDVKIPIQRWGRDDLYSVYQ
jgi:hypothetical protein